MPCLSLSVDGLNELKEGKGGRLELQKGVRALFGEKGSDPFLSIGDNIRQ